MRARATGYAYIRVLRLLRDVDSVPERFRKLIT